MIQIDTDDKDPIRARREEPQGFALILLTMRFYIQVMSKRTSNSNESVERQETDLVTLYISLEFTDGAVSADP